MSLSLEQLEKLVAGEGVAIRVRQRLQPAGGAGDKIFPPTYATGDQKLKYAVEVRKIDGKDVQCVLLDSVASQANRMEEALLSAWQADDLAFPVLSVKFDDHELSDIGSITTLQAPHRIADAILRDAIVEQGGRAILFRDTVEGRAYTNASTRNATVVFELCPTALVFGVWDSTGPKGGLGAKFQRALTSEIMAIDASTGVKVGSRIDPLAIGSNVEIYHRADDPTDWTIDPNEAQKDKNNKPVLFSRSGGDGKKGKASSVNHSNVAPTVDSFSGGITFDHAVQTVVLSLPALRKLHFTSTIDGAALDANAEAAARTTLAALGLAAIVHLRERGYDLRSRSLLVPEGELNLEIVSPSGASHVVTIKPADVNKLVKDAAAKATKAGLKWAKEPFSLKAAPKLVALVKRSRAEAVTEDAGS
ncbi:MAG: type I-G CRISPR-associated RAMP protein Csb1/Cas7g [Gemmatimonadales bacterium]